MNEGGKLQLPWPKLGLSDDVNAAEQPPMTTPRAVNVRLIDPRTGRARGAQRAGMTDFFASDLPNRVDHLASISWNTPKIEYTLLTETDNGTTTPAVLTAEWSELLDSPALAVRRDTEGNIYVLLDDDRVQVWNPDQALVDTIVPPLDPGESVTRGLAVDEARRVYVVSTQDNAPGEERLSRVFQFRRIQDPDDDATVYYDRAWTLEVPGLVKEIVAYGGAIVLTRDVTSGDSTARITRYGAVTTATPILEGDTAVPYPVRDIAVSERAEVYFSSPSNPNRGAAPTTTGLHTPLLSWTPHDLGYNQAADDADFSDEERLHAWVSGAYVQGVSQGQELQTLQDRRYVATQETAPGGGQPAGSGENPDEYPAGPDDTTNRYIFTEPTGREGPLYDAASFAGTGGLRFIAEQDNGTGYPGCALRSLTNSSGAFKQPTTITASSGTGTDTTVRTFTDDAAYATTGISINASLPATFQRAYILWTGELDQNQVPLVITTLWLRVHNGSGTPIGPEFPVALPSSGSSVVVNTEIEFTDDGGGIYAVFARFTQSNSSGSATVDLEGATTTTMGEVFTDDFTPDPDGIAAAQRSIVPGHQAAGGYGDNYTCVSTWRMDGPEAMRILAYQNGQTHKWALIGHCEVVSGTLTNSPGYVTLISNQMEGGESQAVQIPGLGGGTGTTFYGVSGDSNAGDNNPDYYALIVFQVSGLLTQGAGAAQQSFLRINGTPAGRFSIRLMESWGAGSFVLLGNKHWNRTPQPEDLFPESVTFEPFEGVFGEWITVLGSTDTLANDTPTTYPTASGNPPDGGAASGTLDPANYNTVTPDTGGAFPTGSYTGAATEIERLEGGVAHARGMANFLPNGIGGTDVTTGLFNDHPFGGSGSPPAGFAGDVPLDELTRILLSPRPVFGKIGPTGNKILWALNGSGLGNGCVALPDRYVVTIGEKDSSDGGNGDVVMRRIFDGGNTYSLAADDGAWTYEDTAFTPTFAQPSVIGDEAGNVYWTVQEDMELVKHDGTDGTRVWTYAEPDSLAVTQAVLDPVIPIYPPGTDEEDEVPVFIYLGGTYLRKVRTVAETQVVETTESPRRTRYLACSRADFYTSTTDLTLGTIPAAAIPTGGTGAFDATRILFQSCTLNNKWYGTDGRNYVVYDPIANELSTLKSAKRGELPKRARLMAAWQGRILLARTQDDESTLFASRQGAPLDWDYFPPNPSAVDAWNSTLQRGPGRVPDIITALIELDDILLVGCDHSIYKLVGDPGFGGRIHEVSDQTGIAFGKAWTKDPEGIVYFFGQRGGVYRVTRGLDSLVGVERISERRIERRLQEIDLTGNRVELVWDYKNEGLHVLTIPYGGVSVQSNYFWDKKHNGWYEDRAGAGNRHPTASAVFDGDDPDDRVVALGFSDGAVRYIDETADDDDGTAIASEIWLGPFGAGLPDAEYRWSHLQAVLASDQNPADFAWYVSESPDADLTGLTPVASGTFPAGLSPVNYARARGLYTWLAISGTNGLPWAYEGGSVVASMGGRTRQRA